MSRSRLGLKSWPPTRNGIRAPLMQQLAQRALHRAGRPHSSDCVLCAPTAPSPNDIDLIGGSEWLRRTPDGHGAGILLSAGPDSKSHEIDSEESK